MQFKIIPHVQLLRNTNYHELHIRFLRLHLSLVRDKRGVSVCLDELNTNRFIEWFIDKPTGEINCRIRYKE
jgi:hypothetical protein